MDDEIMGSAEFEAETIRRALAGDAEAGRYALLLCRDQLAARSLSPILADYLAERLNDVLEEIKPDRALCIAKGVGRKPDPLPDWQQELGAVAALLKRRGYAPQQIANALSDVRQTVHKKFLDNREGYRILETWSPMQNMDDESLRRCAGAYWEKLSEYPPLT